MSKAKRPLTVHKIERLTEPGRYLDGSGGLYLVVKPSGARSWILRYECHGRERYMGLGPVKDFTLTEARERARKARQLLNDGIDPLDARRAAHRAAATAAAQAAAVTMTFSACAEQYYKFHSPKWKNHKHAAQFLSTLKTYAYPTIGKLPVADIKKAIVIELLKPIWYTKTETASRVRARIEAVLDYARVNGYRPEGENPAAWDGNLEHALPAHSQVAKVKHHPALPYAEMPIFMAALQEREGIGARALEFLILTAARTNEVCGARWSEIDFDAKTWTVPAERMKARREHRVPLSDRAMTLLEALPREGEFLFLGGRKGMPISNMAMAETVKRMGRNDITVHGFRSTMRDWTAETTAYPNHVAEMALGHAVGSKVEASYRRGDLFDKRKRLMAEWAQYCLTPRPEANETNVVVPIRRGA